MIPYDPTQIALRSESNMVGKFREHVIPRRSWLSVAGGPLAFSAAGAVAARWGKSIINGSLVIALVDRGV